VKVDGLNGSARDRRGANLVEQQLDLVAADTHGIVRSAGHEPHSWALAPEEPHRVVDERLEGVAIWRVVRGLSRISDTTRHRR